MRTLLALSLSTAVAVLAFAACARAGTYPMHQCRASPTLEVSGSWRSYGPGGMFDSCGANDSFGVWMGEMPYDSTGGLTIAVPPSRPHVTIAGVAAATGVANEVDQYAFLRWFADGSVLFDQEMTGWFQAISRSTPTGARDFGIDLYCSFGNGPANCRFNDLHRAVAMPWLTFTLAESAPPGGQANGGSLLAPGARKGTESLAWSAADEDSGVRRVVVSLGGNRIAAYDYGSACTYSDWNACPTSRGDVLDVDTTDLPDGAYPLRLEVTDAAGNERLVDTGRSVTIANHPPAAPAPTAGAGPASAASVDHGGHNGSGTADAAVLVAELVNRRQTMVVPYRRSAVTISGRLTQQDGTPITGARLDVGSQTAVPGLPGPDGGQVTTDAEGRWALTTVQGPSRDVSVAWRAFDRDRSYSETTRLSVLVRAGATLAVHPRRIRNGGMVTLSGRLLGAPYPAGGVLVTLQGRPRRGGRWRTFGVTRSKADGRFGYGYRFTRVAGGERMFLFRARVSRQNGYPYEAGIAGSARANVRP